MCKRHGFRIDGFGHGDTIFGELAAMDEQTKPNKEEWQWSMSIDPAAKAFNMHGAKVKLCSSEGREDARIMRVCRRHGANVDTKGQVKLAVKKVEWGHEVP